MASTAPKARLSVIGAVALGGVLGAAARVGLPWPSLGPDLGILAPLPLVIINLTGAILLGLTVGYTRHRDWPEAVMKGITTGFLGSFTTMSGLALVYFGLLLVPRAGWAGLLLATCALVIFLWFTTVCTGLALRLGDSVGRVHT